MRNLSILIALVTMLAGTSLAIPWPVGETQADEFSTRFEAQLKPELL